jgi:uncharacterized protein (TIGR03000 family)
MRYLSPLIVLAVAGPAFGQLPPVNISNVYVPPAWTLPGTVGAIAVYPDPTRGYYGTARFFAKFWTAVENKFGRMGEELEPELVMVPLDPRLDPTRARLTLHVPATAEVFVEGEKMKGLGATRELVSPPLEPGRTYRYAIAVRWPEGNKLREQTFNVPVRAGDTPALLVLGPLSGK